MSAINIFQAITLQGTVYELHSRGRLPLDSTNNIFERDITNLTEPTATTFFSLALLYIFIHFSFITNKLPKCHYFHLEAL